MSFFADGGDKKRKRTATYDGTKKRIATSSKGGMAAKRSFGGGKKVVNGKKTTKTRTTSRRGQNGDDANQNDNNNNDDDDDESISGSDSDEEARMNSNRKRLDDEEEDNSSDEEDEYSDLEGRDDEPETAAERRRRLAEQYLQNVQKDVEEAEAAQGEYVFDAADVDRDLIAERLQEDVAETKGKVYRRVAEQLGLASASRCLWRWNAQNVNAVAVCPPFAYTVTSDAYLTKWRLQETAEEQAKGRKKNRKERRAAERGGEGGQKEEAIATVTAATATTKKRPERVQFRFGDFRRRKDKSYQGHVGSILTVAASQDGRFVVTGGADGRLVVHDASSLKVLRVFFQHRDAVTGLSFRRGTNQLYSCGRDRTVKIWSLDELAYVQTLFGHQDTVADVAALAQERCLTAGTRDRTARLWKVIEETQLVFQREAKKQDIPGGVDRVAMLDDELFVTGGDDGALVLWSIQKKRPLCVVPRAHGMQDAPTQTQRARYDAEAPEDATVPSQPRWITALCALPYADVVLTGSWDGVVRVWKLSEDKRKLEALGVLGGVEDGDETEGDEPNQKQNIPGIVNDIAVYERGDRGHRSLVVVVAVGREPRLGRWEPPKGARNGAVVFEVPEQRFTNGKVAVEATAE